MDWKKIFLPHREPSKTPKTERKKELQFTIGKRVCFLQKTKDGEVYGIGEIKTIKSTPVVSKTGKIESFLYVADIQPLYEVPKTWKLSPLTEEHSSDDPLNFTLPDTAILCSRLRIRMKLPESKSNYTILKAVRGETFCLATYYDFLRFYSKEC